MVLPDITATGVFDSYSAYINKKLTKIRKTSRYELELPIQYGGVSYVNKETHSITENIVIFAKPGFERHSRLPYKCYYVHMTISEGELFQQLSGLPTFIPITDREKIEPLFAFLSKYSLSVTPQEKLLYASKLLELIYLLSSQYNQTILPSTPNSTLMNSIIQYVKEHPEADLSLATLAQYANLSPTYFHSQFKKYTGTTLQKFVEEQRITKAISLLLSTNMTLSEIADMCGFSSQSYFSYTFKRMMNMPPREYAKEHFRKYEI